MQATRGRATVDLLSEEMQRAADGSFLLPKGLSWDAVASMAARQLQQRQQRPAPRIGSLPPHTAPDGLQATLQATLAVAANIAAIVTKQCEHAASEEMVDSTQQGGSSGGGSSGSGGNGAGQAKAPGAPAHRPAFKVQEQVRQLLIFSKLRGLEHGTTRDGSECAAALASTIAGS